MKETEKQCSGVWGRPTRPQQQRVHVRFDQEFYYLKVPASHLSSWWIWKRIPVSSYTKIVLHTNNLYLCILCGGDFIVYSDLFIGFYGFLPDWFYSLLRFIYWLLWLFAWLIDFIVLWFHELENEVSSYWLIYCIHCLWYSWLTALVIMLWIRSRLKEKFRAWRLKAFVVIPE